MAHASRIQFSGLDRTPKTTGRQFDPELTRTMMMWMSRYPASADTPAPVRFVEVATRSSQL